MSLNFTTLKNWKRKNKKTETSTKNKFMVNKSGKKNKKRGASPRDLSTSRLRPKPKLKKPRLTLTQVHFNNFEIQKNKVQIRETDENNEEILHDAYVLSIKGEINFTYEFI